MTLGEVVGLLLGAQPRHIEARVEYAVDGVVIDAASIVADMGRKWHVEFDDGRIVDVNETGSVVRVPGRRVMRGPVMDAQTIFGAPLLMPRHALIWGRPGEDWRLGESAVVRDGRVQVDLTPTDDRPYTGYLLADAQTGHVVELALGPEVWRLELISRESGPASP